MNGINAVLQLFERSSPEARAQCLKELNIEYGGAHPRWMSRDDVPTDYEAIGHGGWFYVRAWTHDATICEISVRYFDDSNSSWWAFNTNHDARTLTPNNSFDQWLRLTRNLLKE